MKFAFLCLNLAISFNSLADGLEDAGAWMRPLLGKHRMSGGRGCESVVIGEVDMGLGTPVVALAIGDEKTDLFYAYESGELSISSDQLSYNHVDRSGVFGCGEGRKTSVEAKKDGKGNLNYLQIREYQGSGCGPSWAKSLDLLCEP